MQRKFRNLNLILRQRNDDHRTTVQEITENLTIDPRNNSNEQLTIFSNKITKLLFGFSFENHKSQFLYEFIFNLTRCKMCIMVSHKAAMAKNVLFL